LRVLNPTIDITRPLRTERSIVGELRQGEFRGNSSNASTDHELLTSLGSRVFQIRLHHPRLRCRP
jgi:hypothetical protein